MGWKPLLFLMTALTLPASGKDTVVLLHGLGLGSWAMKRMEWALEKDGYEVLNLSYPSRTMPLEELSGPWLSRTLDGAKVAEAGQLHFVTHSMGGIILRAWLRDHHPANLGRVVMLAPPNQGSLLVDRIGAWKSFRVFTGVNGRRLGTGSDSFPMGLGPWTADAPLGIIAGNRKLIPGLSRWAGAESDGKVSVASTRLDGMTDHLVLPHSHTWIQYRKPVINRIRTFLQNGRFAPEAIPAGR